MIYMRRYEITECDETLSQRFTAQVQVLSVVLVSVLTLGLCAARPQVKPDLFILSPLSEQKGPDVCLAAGFRPAAGQMVLTVKDRSVTMDTRSARLSPVEATYFFTGFNRDTIDSCELQGEVKRRGEEEKPECEEKPEDPTSSPPGTS